MLQDLIKCRFCSTFFFHCSRKCNKNAQIYWNFGLKKSKNITKFFQMERWWFHLILLKLLSVHHFKRSQKNEKKKLSNETGTNETTYFSEKSRQLHIPRLYKFSVFVRMCVWQRDCRIRQVFLHLITRRFGEGNIFIFYFFNFCILENK